MRGGWHFGAVVRQPSVIETATACVSAPQEPRPSKVSLTLPPVKQPEQVLDFIERMQSFLSGKLPEQIQSLLKETITILPTQEQKQN